MGLVKLNAQLNTEIEMTEQTNVNEKNKPGLSYKNIFVLVGVWLFGLYLFVEMQIY